MSQDPITRRHGRRLNALAAIAALSLGSLALAGCGTGDDELPPMEQPADPPTEEPAQQAPMGDEPMGDEPADPTMGEEPMDTMESQDPAMGDPAMGEEEPMMDDEEPGGF